MNSEKTILVSVEGNIGSGKTTVLKALEEAMIDDSRVAFSEEPAESWEASGALSALYSGKVSPSFFQMFVLSTRTASILRQLNEKSPTILISERTLFFGERAFADICIENAEEKKMYQACSSAYGSLIEAKATMLYIFVDTDPEICLSRIKARGRASESSIDLEYLHKLDSSHRRLVAEKGERVIKIDGNQDKSTVLAQVLALIQSLAGGINKENIDPSTTKKTNRNLAVVTPNEVKGSESSASTTKQHIHIDEMSTPQRDHTKKKVIKKKIHPRTILGDKSNNKQC
mmetsp:Transcript_3230/g.4471  ORF Transcript_3230/g.4471 Transcript_3230/m.4471 type:complete len:287 (-) Transcript_3230:211-1071(-)